MLVVGTTPDYIHFIRENYPGRALFLTDPKARRGAAEPAPCAGEEILVGLYNEQVVLKVLSSHLRTHGIKISGVACFDCEALELAAVIASEFGLGFVSVEAVRNCRDKFVCKQIWQENQIPCPEIQPVNTLEQAQAFLRECPRGIVLKPFYGSGSELVFRCKTATDCETSFNTIREGLGKRKSHPLFKKQSSTRFLMLAEEFAEGPEYSCDMFIDNGAVRMIRLAKKIKLPYQPFGTIAGYILPARLPEGMDGGQFEAMLLKSARVLGVNKGICMVDFVVNDLEAKLIELTPRPGGDCLPELMRTAGNLDMIGLTLDFAQKRPINLNDTKGFPVHIGLRIHAHKAGVLKSFNMDELASDSRIKRINITRKPGHRITMPPEDYDSWLLGHMIIKPEKSSHLESQSLLIGKRLKVEIAS